LIEPRRNCRVSKNCWIKKIDAHKESKAIEHRENKEAEKVIKYPNLKWIL
jgi:hypothetical protein